MKVVAIGFLSDLSVSVSKKDDERKFYHAKMREYPNDFSYLSVNLPSKDVPAGKCEITLNITQRFVGESEKKCFTSFNVVDIKPLS